MRFVIVTGMSGGGKSHAIRMLEDAGFYCVDNLPVSLIRTFIDLLALPDVALELGAFQGLGVVYGRLGVRGLVHVVLLEHAWADDGGAREARCGGDRGDQPPDGHRDVDGVSCARLCAGDLDLRGSGDAAALELGGEVAFALASVVAALVKPGGLDVDLRAVLQSLRELREHVLLGHSAQELGLGAGGQGRVRHKGAGCGCR